MEAKKKFSVFSSQLIPTVIAYCDVSDYIVLLSGPEIPGPLSCPNSILEAEKVGHELGMWGTKQLLKKIVLMAR